MASLCSYAECVTVQTPGSRLAFFVLPQDQRRQTWILNSGNPNLLDLSATAKRYFCELHFRKCDIRRQFHRCTLRRDAILLPHRPHNPKEFRSYMSRHTKSNDTLSETRSSAAEPLGDELDDLIVTDYEGSNRTGSIHAASEIEPDYFDNVDFLDNSEIDDTDHIRRPSVSPTNQSSLVSNVIIQPAASITLDSYSTELPPPEEHLNESVSASSIPAASYPSQRALLRRRKRRALLLQQRRRFPAEKRKPPTPKKVRAQQRTRRATPDISLEDVAGKTEDTYFALSLVGSLERLSARKRATAKLHILQYLTELAFAED